jgi:hypothetical protein
VRYSPKLLDLAGNLGLQGHFCEKVPLFWNLDILLHRLNYRKPLRLALFRAEDLTFCRKSDRFRAFLRAAHRNPPIFAVFWVYLCFFRHFSKSPIGGHYNKSIRNFNPVLHIYRSFKTIEWFAQTEKVVPPFIIVWEDPQVNLLGMNFLNPLWFKGGKKRTWGTKTAASVLLGIVIG